MKLSNLLKQDIDFVGKKKITFLIPTVVVILAIIAGVIFGLVKGNPINFGMDFTGGYTINVQLATKLTEDNYDDYVQQINDIFDNLTDDEGNNYGVRISSTQLQGADENASIYIRYQALKGDSDLEVQTLMEEHVNPKLIEKLNELFQIAPQSVTYVGAAISVQYLENISEPMRESIAQNAVNYFNEKSLNVSSDDIIVLATDPKTVLISISQPSEEVMNDLKSVLTINDKYSGEAIQGNLISPVVGAELLVNAIFAVITTLILMLIYIALRFELLSGLAAVAALLHDLIMMFSVLVIFHIEINSTFIAALVTILGYSINNSIIVFDRVRENSRLLGGAQPKNIANKSLNETLVRSINTTITTLIMIGFVAIIGVQSIRIFALPIIIGLVAGVFSSLMFAPTLWVTWKQIAIDRGKSAKKSDTKAQTT